MYRPVVIKGFTGQTLRNLGDETRFYDANETLPETQWVIYPLSNGSVIVKSLKDQRNLQVLPDGRARVDNCNELLWEQFNIETNY